MSAPVAVAAIETSSIAQGVVVGDAVMKMAEVELLQACTLSPGKYWVMFGGDVAPVKASHQRGIEVAADALLDTFLIPQLHPMVLAAMAGTVAPEDHDALGVLETLTAASAILGADRAAKAADIVLRDIRLANGLGGKGIVLLSGAVSDVEAAIDAGRADAIKRGLLARSVVIPRLHRGMRTRILGG